MTQILTVICSGSQWDIEKAIGLAESLVLDNILVRFENGESFRPVQVMGEDAIEVCCPVKHWNQAMASFHSHGFGFPGYE